MTLAQQILDIEAVVRLTTVLLSVHVILTSLQHLSTRDRYTDGGILNWHVLQFYLRMTRVSRLAEPFLKQSRFRWVLLVRLLAGACLGVFAILQWVSPVLLFVILLADVGIALRHNGGLSGDYHVAIVTNIGILVASAAPEGSLLQVVGVVFIAVQSLLSYLISGISKLTSSEWRDGSATVAVFSTRTWGHGAMYDFLRTHPRLNLALSWKIILFESLFVLVIAVEQPWALLILGGGVLFHAATAVFMRLNGFLFAFPATYPAVLYANHLVHTWIF